MYKKIKDAPHFARCSSSPGWQLSQCVPSLCGATVATRLLLKHIYGVVVLHVEACWRVCLVDWLAVKSEPNVLDAQARTIAVSRHELPQWRVLFDFEVDDAAVLSNNLQIDMFVVWFNVLLVVRHFYYTYYHAKTRRTCPK